MFCQTGLIRSQRIGNLRSILSGASAEVAVPSPERRLVDAFEFDLTRTVCQTQQVAPSSFNKGG